MLTRRRLLLKERPDNWTLNPASGLAQGLQFFGGGNAAGGSRMYDASRFRRDGTLTLADQPAWFWSGELRRWIIRNLNLIPERADVIQSVYRENCFASAMTHISVACWYRIETNVTLSRQMTIRIADDSADGQDYMHGMQIAGIGQPYFRLVVDGSRRGLIGAVTVAQDEWHHAAGVYDGSRMLVYQNGELTAQTDRTGALENYPDLRIGCRNDIDYNNALGGAFADPLIFSRVLTPPEIQQLADPGNVMLSGLILPPRRRLWAVGSAGPTFNPAWARNCNNLIGAGI